MAYEALHSLRETLNRFLKQNHHPDINREIISIHDEVVACLLHLKSNPENLEEREGIREEANATEEIIEYLLSEDNPLYGGQTKPTVDHSNQLRKAAEYFKSAVHSVNSKRRRLGVELESPPRVATTSKNVVVGFDEDLNEIRNRLLIQSVQPKQLQVLSIVGRGGTGKTTLAKLVYNDDVIVKHFSIRAWITVSQDYSVRSILYNLLASLGRGVAFERDEQREIPMESLIRTHLDGWRFLIVIDDMCSNKAWDDLHMLFPDTNSSSRIILTTRLNDVATYVGSSIPIHTMHLLDAYHSWDLLKQKVFVNGSCPLELEDIGRKIMKNCEGLPLSIVVVAGILTTVPRTRQSWKKIAANDGNLEKVISLSYNHLPSHMRTCFLYMGGFPEDYEIRVSELRELWRVEGLLKCITGSKSLEDEAVELLENLVERNLILVSRRNYGGEIKSCSLHDMVREFCIRQGEREKILLSVMDYLPSPILRRHFLPRLLKDYGRISASWHDLDLKDYMHSSVTHSIICIPQRVYRHLSSLHKFSSVRVFHVLCRNNNWKWDPSQMLGREASQVFDLIHLTYLASNIPTSIVPPAISKLQNLETLNIYRSDVVLPVEIWMLRQLRHLRAFSFNSLPLPGITTLPQTNLQTVSLVMDFVCSGRMVEIIPNIKKLGICYLMDSDNYLNNVPVVAITCLNNLSHLYPHIYNLEFIHYVALCYLNNLIHLRSHLDNLGHLPQLEKLKLESRGCFSSGVLVKNLKFGMPRDLLEILVNSTIERQRPIFHFPQSLKKLTLCGLGLLWKDMWVIGSLPNLLVLKLRNYAFSGENWRTNDGEFGELRFLLIEGSDLKCWTAQETNFRRLQYLILANCPNLFEISSEIGDIPTLKLIVVDTRKARRKLFKIFKSGNYSFEVRTMCHD